VRAPERDVAHQPVAAPPTPTVSSAPLPTRPACRRNARRLSTEPPWQPRDHRTSRATPGLTCRIYWTDIGVEPAPTVEQLRAALTRSEANGVSPGPL